MITPNEGFSVTRIFRADLEKAGFDASKVDDATMRKLAFRMATDYCEQLFWSSLEIIADHLKIPKANHAKQ
jgi:hypothetical protein